MAAFLACTLLAACATRIDTSERNTKPPRTKLGSYERVLIAPLVLGPNVNEERDSAAVERVEFGIGECLAEKLGAMPRDGIPPAPNVRTLVAAPEIVEMKKVSVGARLLAGPFAGSSAILLRVAFSEAASGETIASPVFYARGNAIAGSYTAAATDNRMLTRIVALACRYIEQHR